jgi:hypothetical protein
VSRVRRAGSQGRKGTGKHTKKERRKHWREIGIALARLCWDFEKRKSAEKMEF